MNIREKIISLIRPPIIDRGERSIYVDPGVVTYVIGTESTSAPSYNQMVTEAYDVNSTVRACLSELTAAISSLPIKVKSGETILDSHPLLDLLNSPTPTDTWDEWVTVLVDHLYLDGNAFVLPIGITRSAGVQELRILSPDKVSIEARENDKPIYIYRPTSNRSDDVVIKYDEMIHFRIPHPTSKYRGVSPLKSVSYDIDTANEIKKWQLDLARSRGRGPGKVVINDPNVILDPQKDIPEIVSSIKQMQKTNGTLILRPGMDYQSIGSDPNDTNMMDIQREAATAICSILRVPPEVIGDFRSKTYNSYEEAKRSFWTEGVIPVVEKIVQKLQRHIAPYYGDIDIIYDTSTIDVLKPDTLSNDYVIKSLDANIIDKSEARKLLGVAED